ncbi:MAG TPA: cytochrome c oxidase subunit II [Candidatus Entotheonella sp.]
MLTAAHAWAGPQSTLDPQGPVAQMQHRVFMVSVMVCTAVFLLTAGLLVYAVWRFRARPGRIEATLRPAHGNPKLEAALIAVVTLLLLTIAVPNIRVLFAASEPPDIENALRVEVVGKQWWWQFSYPSFEVETANELHIPVGRTVIAQLRTEDVMHSFWVPKLAGKMDLIPNKINYLWFRADAPGVYYGQCAEFCGSSHANMRLRVIVHPEDAFASWIQAQQAAAEAPTEALAQEGAQVFQQRCTVCHAVAGTPANGKTGPNLTHFGSRQTLAAGLLPNSPPNVARWLQNPQAVKPGSRMPNLGLSEAEVQALTAYLQQLK